MKDNSNDRIWIFLTLVLGIFSLAGVAAYHNLSDGDLWAKLSLGAFIWHTGELPREDIFAFTPVLPVYRDHEWGAGTIFYLVLLGLGGPGLMLLKIILFAGSLLIALRLSKTTAGNWTLPFLLAIPAALCALPGFVPVVRSHALTYFFFALTLWALERLWQGKKSCLVLLLVIMLVWANCHGGFVSGLGTVGVFAASSLLINRKQFPYFAAAVFGGAGVTLINPYGIDLWTYLIPALHHPRPAIAEWQPLPIWGWDAFIGFRIFFGALILALLLGWKNIGKESLPRILMLLITSYLAWKSRRHAPFFGIAALAFSVPIFQGAWMRLSSWFYPVAAEKRVPALVITILYALVAFGVTMKYLPQASWRVLAPVGSYPVREVDILAAAKAEGNLAVPFSWGSYASWRLYPKIKVSMDGRYEAVYPESTFQMNQAFYNKGTNWDLLLRNHTVDFIILDMRFNSFELLDLNSRGYEFIWQHAGQSALFALEKHAPQLREAARLLPPTTIDPLDASIPKKWWEKRPQKKN